MYKLDAITVLIVEDNKPMLNLISSILQTFGVGRIETAINGEEGFEVYCKTNPDLVIADWMMAPCDGITMSKKIRNSPKSPNQYVPIILMTGFSEKKRVLSARDAGITEFLVKPFNARGLYRRITQAIEKPRPFIRCEDFFGPDRRRKSPHEDEYNGPRRRKGDKAESGSKKSSFIIPEEIDFVER